MIKKKPKKLTEQQVRSRIETFMLEMESLFDFQNWDRSIVFEKIDSKNNAAEIKQDIEYRRVTIFIFPRFFLNSLKNQREYLLHELCHTFSHKLFCAGVDLINGDRVHSYEALKAVNEEATCRVTLLIQKLLLGKRKWAGVAFAKYIK